MIIRIYRITEEERERERRDRVRIANEEALIGIVMVVTAILWGIGYYTHFIPWLDRLLSIFDIIGPPIWRSYPYPPPILEVIFFPLQRGIFLLSPFVITIVIIWILKRYIDG